MTSSMTRAEKLQKLANAKRQLGPLLPLTTSQQRFWFIEQLEQNSGLNNIFKAMFVIEPLNITNLQQALYLVTQRHPIMCSRFINTKNGPRQHTVPTSTALLTIINASTLEEAKTLASKDSRRGFALSSELPFRATLYVLPQQQYLITLCIHHIIADGYALNLILSEWRLLYRQQQDEEVAILASPTINMQQFLQQEKLTEPEALEQFWQETLKDCEQQLQISRKSNPLNNEGDYYYFNLPTELSVQLTQFCQSQHITPFNLLLAVFNLLLYKLSEQRNFIIATPILNRDQPQLKHFVAPVANTLLIPACIDSKLGASQYVHQLRERFYQCLAHQQLSYAQILELLKPERNINRNPLFQVMFSYNALHDALADSDNTWQSSAIKRHYAKLDLTLEVSCQHGEYQGYFEYNKALFEQKDINKYTEHFVNLLQQLIATPEKPISQFALSSLAQQQKLLSHLPKVDCGQQDILQLLARTVERQPQKEALTQTEDEYVVNYAELWQLVLHHNAVLQQQGVQPGDVIAISCEHRLTTIIAMLSVLAAGGCFVILDTDISNERKQFLYQDSQARLTLSDQPNSADILITLQPTLLLDSTVLASQANHSAYIVYTSGTTGTPKGVMIKRQALNNHAFSMVQHYQLTQYRTSLQSSALSFDLALEEIFPSLLAGCHLLLPPQKNTLTFTELMQLINQYKIEHLSLSTAYWQSWVNSLLESKQHLPTCIRQIVVGTEQLTGPGVSNWFELNSQATLFNAYGPSEATISCSIHKVCPEDKAAFEVPIGKAIAPNQLYILDTDLMPVPANVKGQLYIGGENLALGYQNQASLTASKFIYHPQSGNRLYASGDIVYFRDDGNICFAGRNDQQVKLRGYRIELEGIRQQILRAGTVAECYVMIIEPQQLVAYIVPRSQRFDLAELRQYLELQLAEYMLPQQLVVLDSLPLTSRGKIDRTKLPLPHTHGESATAEDSDDIIEHAILEIWQHILPSTPLHMTQNFFNAGGHSLLALSVLARIKDNLQTSISLRQFFQQPTIRALAKLVREQSEQQPVIPVLRQPKQKVFPLTASQQQMWVLHQLDSSAAAYNMPMLLLLTGELDIACLQLVLQKITQQQAAFHTTYFEDDGTILQRIDNKIPLQFTKQDISHSADNLAEHFASDSNLPFALTDKPAYRFILYRLAANRHALGVVIHHINADGSSFQLLTRQLIQGYQQLIQNQDWQAAQPQLQISDLALWQQQQDYQQWQQQQQSYWLRQLKDVPQLIELATDFSRPPQPSFQGGRCRFNLNADIVNNLKSQAEQLGSSLYMLSFAICAQLLHEFSRQDDFVIGIPVSGRDNSQYSELIGLLLNTLPIRMKWQPGMTCSQLVAQAKQHILSGFEHQQFQLPELLQQLNIERSTSHNPLFQVLFNFNHSTSSGQEGFAITDQLALTMPNSDNHSARFDLSFSLTLKNNQLSGFIEYSQDLFLADSVQLMVTRLVQLFSQFAQNTDRPLVQLEQELQAVFLEQLPKFNTNCEPKFKDLYSWFTNTAKCYPNKLAVFGSDRQLSYQQLLQEADSLAAKLYSNGVRPGDLVAVCLPRNSELVITLLAIFRCQAAYLPLDPEYPQERLQYIVSDAAVCAIITTESLQQQLALQGAPIWLLSQLQQQAVTFFPLLQNQPQHLAYCIYTSGSTGLPKGVEVSQHSMLNFLAAMATEPGITDKDKVLAITPISFDISVLELFLPLLYGASMVLLPHQKNRDGYAIAQYLDEHQISIMQATPAGWRLLLESGWAGQSNLTMLTGGEALPKVLAERLLNKGRELWNMYGPTEATVWISCQRITVDSLELISTGKAISNNRLYVMNPSGDLAAIGSKGELFIAGDNLALGYRGKAELTADRFITKQWLNGSQERLYRTGDLVKQLADGRLLYLQRLDEQVKLHGYRIELTEIEAIVERHPKVKSCAAVLSKASNGEPILTTFYTADIPLAISDLTEYAAKWLPSYMQPTSWQQLETLPTTPSGKVDKKQLSQLEQIEQLPHQELSSSTEHKLATLWQKLLGINVNNSNSNFFRLGGNSVLAMKLLALIRQDFGEHLTLTLGDLFVYQQLDQLAKRLDELQLQSVDEDELLALMAEITG
ncbi:amino acid adenylation domain-containing protein [Rheinheimera sp. WS51]|uniref:amino acid adenylation domain-containing protein n=1 Tax=Rheinheimera sp. WS51 TaxID=3425886 RepID=UPI003D8E7F0C